VFNSDIELILKRHNDDIPDGKKIMQETTAMVPSHKAKLIRSMSVDDAVLVDDFDSPGGGKKVRGSKERRTGGVKRRLERRTGGAKRRLERSDSKSNIPHIRITNHLLFIASLLAEPHHERQVPQRRYRLRPPF